ncbi:hypothetical protein [Ureibacillus sp. FSL W8-0352]|uniref:hypothetical protein n=1 Tax=Ureibacillus sp. FSL W8-0352 TaxID=2954596 RepID=UPI0030F6EAAC
MVYVQTNLYQFISLSDDPVFRKINNLKIGDEIQIDSFKVRKTERFYEVENEDLHELFNSLDKCYSFISSMI